MNVITNRIAQATQLSFYRMHFIQLQIWAQIYHIASTKLLCFHVEQENQKLMVAVVE